jgi:hypothetical protein
MCCDFASLPSVSVIACCFIDYFYLLLSSHCCLHNTSQHNTTQHIHTRQCLALGARAVFLGRPVLWGLGAAGEEGVHHVMELLRAELELAMALSGCSQLAVSACLPACLSANGCAVV